MFSEFNQHGLSEQEFERLFLEKEDRALGVKIFNVERNIKLIIRHELRVKGNGFSLNGISMRIDHYTSNICTVYNLICNNFFCSFLEDFLTVTSYKGLYGSRNTRNNLHPAGDSFLKTYESVGAYYLPDVRGKLNGDIAISITAYTQFLHFKNIKGKVDKNQVYCIPAKYTFTDWLSGNMREDFVKFLTQKCGGAKIGYHETGDAQNDQRVKKMLLDFQPEHSSLLQYTDAIDRSVLSVGDAF